MSLQYIVDAYNLINHPAFKPAAKSVNIQQALADFIRFNKLSGSKNNTVILVFDGYPPEPGQMPQASGLTCMFSRTKEADELIKIVIENSPSPRNIVVVSDDKEVQLTSRFLHARVMSVEEFICGKVNIRSETKAKLEESDFKLSYSKMEKINAELKKKWLS
jgi:predicted RNA-binding protein with PIN domain